MLLLAYCLQKRLTSLILHIYFDVLQVEHCRHHYPHVLDIGCMQKEIRHPYAKWGFRDRYDYQIS